MSSNSEQKRSAWGYCGCGENACLPLPHLLQSLARGEKDSSLVLLGLFWGAKIGPIFSDQNMSTLVLRAYHLPEQVSFIVFPLGQRVVDY